jgi:hypothetical protein
MIYMSKSERLISTSKALEHDPHDNSAMLLYEMSETNTFSCIAAVNSPNAGRFRYN